MLVYGKSGVGKTPLLASAPSPIILSGEKGLLSIRRTHTAFIDISSFAAFKEACRWVAESHEARQFYTIGLDSLSEIAETVLTERKRVQKDPRKAYGDVADEVIAYVKAIRDLPGRTVVLIAKEEYDKDEATGFMMYGPMFPGKQLGPKLPYYFDETFRMIDGRDQTNQKFTALHTTGSFQHVARDRSGNLAEYEQPNLTHIFEKILGYRR